TPATSGREGPGAGRKWPRSPPRSHYADDRVSSCDTPVTRAPCSPYHRGHEATGGSHEAAGSRPVPCRRHALSPVLRRRRPRRPRPPSPCRRAPPRPAPAPPCALPPPARPAAAAPEEKSMRGSDVLVDADWLQEHLDDPSIAIVEVDEDTSAYEKN